MTYHAQPRTPREPFIVRPREGYLVRHPRTGVPLPPEGRDCSDERTYFSRRIANGDCERVTPQRKD